jgi:hypothetical protein
MADNWAPGSQFSRWGFKVPAAPNDWLNIACLILAGLLVWRLLKAGGLALARMMNRLAAVGDAH